MTLDTTQQRFGHALNFDYPAHPQQPAFSNPWSSSSAPQPPTSNSSLFVGSQHPSALSHHSLMASKAPGPRTSSSGSSLGSYGSMPVSTPSADLLHMNRMHTTSAAYGDATYATTASPVSGHFASTSAAPYETMGYAPAPLRPPPFGMAPESESTRRYSQTFVTPSNPRRTTSNETTEASHLMIEGASQTLSTPATACSP
jgi:hypothetical protein